MLTDAQRAVLTKHERGLGRGRPALLAALADERIAREAAEQRIHGLLADLANERMAHCRSLAWQNVVLTVEGAS
jgi:hypothetical protein